MTRLIRTLFGVVAGAVIGVMFAWSAGLSVSIAAVIGAGILGVAGWLVDTR